MVTFKEESLRKYIYLINIDNLSRLYGKYESTVQAYTKTGNRGDSLEIKYVNWC